MATRKSIIAGERVVVAALVPGSDSAPELVLESLISAVQGAGGIVVGKVLQRRGLSRSRQPGGAASQDRPISGSTLFGSGKVAELGVLCRETRATFVLFFNTLSGTQARNLADVTGCKVLDATALQ